MQYDLWKARFKSKKLRVKKLAAEVCQIYLALAKDSLEQNKLSQWVSVIRVLVFPTVLSVRLFNVSKGIRYVESRRVKAHRLIVYKICASGVV